MIVTKEAWESIDASTRDGPGGASWFVRPPITGLTSHYTLPISSTGQSLSPQTLTFCTCCSKYARTKIRPMEKNKKCNPKTEPDKLSQALWENTFCTWCRQCASPPPGSSGRARRPAAGIAWSCPGEIASLANLTEISSCRTYVNVKGSDLLSVELDHLAGVGGGVVGGDHGVGLGPARVVQVWQGARHQVVSCPAREGRHGWEGGAGKEFVSSLFEAGIGRDLF